MSEKSPRPDYRSLLKEAYLELRDLRSQLDEIEHSRSEPVAIIGLGCRFPGGASDPARFWEILRDGVDAISEVPPDRWDINALYDPDPAAPGKMYTRWGGFLDTVDQFDAHFFGIAPREAVTMDPQQRLLLEVCWEALEHAGQSPDKLAGSPTGVFVAITSADYAQLSRKSGLAHIDAYFATGNAPAIAAGRLSYIMGLQGPAMALDTACSSSLVAVHLACQSLRSGECRIALAGGVNLILTPDTTINFCKARMLAADGRCKTFDAMADGYVRGEGCGVLVLKRLSDALTDHDNILALIRGSATNQDGRSAGITAPNGIAQEAVIRQALANAGVRAAEVGYVETHGTGTSLGDPIEARALAAVMVEGRPPDRPLMIGSVKTNIGHVEAAAGAASLIKVVLVLENGEIPPHLHIKQLNPYFNWDSSPLRVATTRSRWPDGSARRIAGVSGFGFSGTNAHVILEEPPAREAESSQFERSLHLLTLSAKTETALKELARRFAHHLGNSSENLGNVCFTANTGRARFAHRLAVWARSSAEAATKLADAAAGNNSSGVLFGHVNNTRTPKVAFLFTAEDPQHMDLARQLYESQPSFRASLERCDKILGQYTSAPILATLYPEGRAFSPMHAPQDRYPALFALEYALGELWQSWGIKPVAVMGRGIGEYAAACVAGLFSLEDGLKLVTEHARLLQVSALPVQADWERIAREVKYQPLQLPFFSESSRRLFKSKEMLDATNWRLDNGHAPGLPDGLEALSDKGSTILLQIGPTPTRPDDGMPSRPGGAKILPTLERGQDDWQVVLQSAAALFVNGVELDWDQFDRDYARWRVPLPTYPFERKRYWVEFQEQPTALSSASIRPKAGGTEGHPLLGRHLQLAQPEGAFVWECDLDKRRAPYLGDHRIQGHAVVPVSTYIELAEAAARQAFGVEPHTLTELELRNIIFLPDQDPPTVQVILSPAADGETIFHVYGRPAGAEQMKPWTLHATGKLRHNR